MRLTTIFYDIFFAVGTNLEKTQFSIQILILSLGINANILFDQCFRILVRKKYVNLKWWWSMKKFYKNYGDILAILWTVFSSVIINTLITGEP